ncbi:PH domain-containing protein [Corynebacterium caspium]|uniref:PH domain-containing protein n=1 Tax=Corynebacterium caspium TaxID=234828 RepID=UPI001FDEA625|nr:PH domain-containing protein [Corynebacterium caspium]
MNSQVDEVLFGMRGVSSKLITARYIGRVGGLLVVVIALIAASIYWQEKWLYLILGIFIIALVTIAIAIPFQVKWIKWLESKDELFISKGRFFHTYTVVPYGRIQYVHVTAGPLENRFGIKTLTVQTASPTSDCSIPGLPAAEADSLRERLSFMARERISGL